MACDARHERGERFSLLMRRRNVEENEFVGTIFGVPFAEFDGVACVAEIFKIDAFDRAPVFDIKTRYNAFCEHN